MIKSLTNNLINELEEIIKTSPPGSKLPSENFLMQKYQVSRITVRNVLKNFIEKDMIYVLQGKGYFVIPKNYWSKVLSFKAKHTDGNAKLYVYNVPLDEYFIKNYHLNPADYQSVLKVRYKDKIRIKYSIIWINIQVLKNINWKKCEVSILDYIKFKNIVLTTNFKHIKVQMATDFDLKILKLSNPIYLPKKYSFSVSDYNEIVECALETYIPEEFQFYKIEKF